MRQGNGWVRGWGSGSAAQRMAAAMFVSRHSQFLTRDLWLMFFFFFLEMSPNRHRCPFSVVPVPPSTRPPWNNHLRHLLMLRHWARDWRSRLLYSGPVCFSVFGDYVRGGGGGDGGCLTEQRGVPRSAVPYHPSEQIFDGDRGFVLHWGHPGNALLMWSISLLPCLCSFPDGSPRHIIYVVLTRPEHPVVNCCAIRCVCLGSFLWARFNSIVSLVNKGKINYRIIKANLLRKLSSNVIKC